MDEREKQREWLKKDAINFVMFTVDLLSLALFIMMVTQLIKSLGL